MKNANLNLIYNLFSVNLGLKLRRYGTVIIEVLMVNIRKFTTTKNGTPKYVGHLYIEANLLRIGIGKQTRGGREG